MSAEENKALYRRWWEVINQHQLDRVDEFIAPDAVDHASPPGLPSGPEGVKQVLTLYRTAFPDLRIAIQDLIAEGDKVVGIITVHGTHRGAFMGIAPTGKPVTIQAIDVVRIAGGKMIEHWSQADNLSVLQQIGAMPAQGRAG